MAGDGDHLRVARRWGIMVIGKLPVWWRVVFFATIRAVLGSETRLAASLQIMFVRFLFFYFFHTSYGNRSYTMPLYPERIARCQHIKVNGMQCGSPALRDKNYCYFHLQWWENTEGVSVGAQKDRWHAAVTLLEDPNSVQMGLGEVMRMLVKRHIDYKTAALLLYGLQTASSNVRRTSFEPADRK